MKRTLSVLQVGGHDLMGQRFNGHRLHLCLNEMGHHSRHCVWAKQSDDPETWELSRFKRKYALNLLNYYLEDKSSLQSIFLPFSFRLLADRRFRQADIIHYQLINGGYFNLFSLPLLSRAKPSVWTIHDPWPLTGYCLHPFDCTKWQTGCGECPVFCESGKPDRTALMWKIKKWVYDRSQFDIIVASRWMASKVQESPLFARSRIHQIPFGLDLQTFRPTDGEEAKRKLGVFPGSLVVCFRATTSEFKGLSHIKECLQRWQPDTRVCLITFNERGLLDDYREKYQIIDLGWVEDESLTVSALNAADIFLMPSTAETFGMMAIEAMACGKPVIVFEGTALPDVVFAPHGGIAVPQGDTEALLQALQRLAGDRAQRDTLGRRALQLAREHYGFDTYVAGVLGLYEEVLGRRAL
jgi:glycosyltransferase involved in cell wall biosynthesis